MGKDKNKRLISKIKKEIGYTNDENPFGDPNLYQPFVWDLKKNDSSSDQKKRKKKKKKKKRRRRSSSGSEESDEEGEGDVGEGGVGHSLAMVEEVKKLRKRREEREKEEEEMIKLREDEFRTREAAQYGEFLQKEEAFHADASWRRSRLRIVNRRRRGVDRLTRNWLIVQDVEREDRRRREGDMTRWKLEDRPPSLTLFLEDKDSLLKDLEELEHSCEVAGEEGSFWGWCKEVLNLGGEGEEGGEMGERVRRQVGLMLDGKSLVGMKAVVSRIQQRLDEGGEEEGFWGKVLRKARRIHLLALLDNSHSTTIKRIQAIRGDSLPKSEEEGYISLEDEETNSSKKSQEKGKKVEDAGMDVMGASDEVALTSTIDWADRFAPRKPLYYNRVKTGYQWSKYNRAHYDHDNPPPRIVQGYRFNIFYPDLVDVTISPSFRLENDPDGSDELCVLRFVAGPPYEDIAFKIVNREWDRHKRSGYKCMFERGVLQLHFNLRHRVYKR